MYRGPCRDMQRQQGRHPHFAFAIKRPASKGGAWRAAWGDPRPRHGVPRPSLGGAQVWACGPQT